MKILAVGTDKGLLLYEKGDTWKLRDIHFIGMPIGAFHEDPSGQWWVAINHKHWGPKLYVSNDQGETFKELETPKFDQGDQLSIKSIWTIQSQQVGPIERIFVGTEPACIFVSKNNGRHFEALEGLSNHPSRANWQGGGKGSNSPFLHSIVLDPDDSNSIIAGISCAGVFKTSDVGNSWEAANTGLKSFFLPNSESEIGHDPHIILRHPLDTQVLWQQNHCGIFRSTDDGDTWNDVSDPEGKAVYGFSMAIDENDVNTAWVIPAQSDDLRYPIQNKLAVFKTHDAGKNWHALRNGLPQQASFDLVLRHGFTKSDSDMAFGTNNGNLYVSENTGENWETLSQSLSTIRSVTFLGV